LLDLVEDDVSGVGSEGGEVNARSLQFFKFGDESRGDIVCACRGSTHNLSPYFELGLSPTLTYNTGIARMQHETCGVS